jgi:hypothetical protein
LKCRYRMRSPNPIRMTALVLPRTRAVSFMAADIESHPRNIRLPNRRPAQAAARTDFFRRGRVRAQRAYRVKAAQTNPTINNINPVAIRARKNLAIEAKRTNRLFVPTEGRAV